MDPRENADTGAVDEGRPEGGRPEEGRPESDEADRSSGSDVITMCLFGAMVIIASICFVIW